MFYNDGGSTTYPPPPQPSLFSRGRSYLMGSLGGFTNSRSQNSSSNLRPVEHIAETNEYQGERGTCYTKTKANKSEVKPNNKYAEAFTSPSTSMDPKTSQQRLMSSRQQPSNAAAEAATSQQKGTPPPPAFNNNCSKSGENDIDIIGCSQHYTSHYSAPTLPTRSSSLSSTRAACASFPAKSTCTSGGEATTTPTSSSISKKSNNNYSDFKGANITNIGHALVVDVSNHVYICRLCY